MWLFICIHECSGTVQFSLKDFGPVNFFIGIEALKTSSGYHITQRKYTTHMLANANFSTKNYVHTPMCQSKKFQIAYMTCLRIHNYIEAQLEPCIIWPSLNLTLPLRWTNLVSSSRLSPITIGVPASASCAIQWLFGSWLVVHAKAIGVHFCNHLFFWCK